jgi:hypothetical protein
MQCNMCPLVNFRGSYLLFKRFFLIQSIDSEPPVYEKKIGRPPKSRRKQPHEVQGKNGPTMSRHGVVIHCSWCHEPHHNVKGCSMKKLGIRPKQPIRRQPPPVDTDHDIEFTQELVQPQLNQCKLKNLCCHKCYQR